LKRPSFGKWRALGDDNVFYLGEKRECIIVDINSDGDIDLYPDDELVKEYGKKNGDKGGEIFDMDMTVFAKDIGDDGVIKVTGLTESFAVVAIDKHGNESKPFIIKNK
jgi:hypothetical protein